MSHYPLSNVTKQQQEEALMASSLPPRRRAKLSRRVKHSPKHYSEAKIIPPPDGEHWIPILLESVTTSTAAIDDEDDDTPALRHRSNQNSSTTKMTKASFSSPPRRRNYDNKKPPVAVITPQRKQTALTTWRGGTGTRVHKQDKQVDDDGEAPRSRKIVSFSVDKRRRDSKQQRRHVHRDRDLRHHPRNAPVATALPETTKAVTSSSTATISKKASLFAASKEKMNSNHRRLSESATRRTKEESSPSSGSRIKTRPKAVDTTTNPSDDASGENESAGDDARALATAANATAKQAPSVGNLAGTARVWSEPTTKPEGAAPKESNRTEEAKGSDSKGRPERETASQLVDSPARRRGDKFVFESTFPQQVVLDSSQEKGTNRCSDVEDSTTAVGSTLKNPVAEKATESLTITIPLVDNNYVEENQDFIGARESTEAPGEEAQCASHYGPTTRGAANRTGLSTLKLTRVIASAKMRAKRKRKMDAESANSAKKTCSAKNDSPSDQQTQRLKALKQVKEDGGNLRFVPDEYKDDKEVVMEAVKNFGAALRYASPVLRDDPDVVVQALQQCEGVLKHASSNLRSDREFLMKAVQRNGFVLGCAALGFRRDRGVVLSAVRQHGNSLQFASAQLRDDFGVVWEAIRQNGESLEFASEELRADKEIVSLAWQQNRRALRYASSELQADRMFNKTSAKAGVKPRSRPGRPRRVSA